MLTSTRYQIVYPNPATRADSADVPRDIAAIVSRLEAVGTKFGYDTIANRPPFGELGRFFISSDESPKGVYFDYGTGWLQVGVVLDGSIVTAKLADGAVTAPKLATGAVTAGKIAADAVTQTELADNSVGPGEIQGGAVTAGKIAAGAVDDSKVAGGLSPSKITGVAVIDSDSRLTNTRTPTDNTVSTGKIVDAAVTAPKIADNIISQAKMAVGNRTFLQSTKPSSPSVGDQWIFNSGNGNWHFVWDGSYWQYIGGAAWYNVQAARDALGVQATWTNLGTFGPSIALPFAGDYLFRWGAVVQVDPAGGSGFGSGSMGLARSAVGITTYSMGFEESFKGDGSNGYSATLSGEMAIGGLNAETIQGTYFGYGPNFPFFMNRWMSVTPRRIP